MDQEQLLRKGRKRAMRLDTWSDAIAVPSQRFLVILLNVALAVVNV